MSNQQPIFSLRGDISANSTNGSTAAMGPTLLTAVGDFTGVSANYGLAWTAGSVDGGFIQRLRFKALGTNIATVARIFINNGGLQTLAVNNVFYGEQTLPATTLNNAAATIDIDYPMGFALNPGGRIYVGLGTTVAAGWRCMGIGGIY